MSSRVGAKTRECRKGSHLPAQVVVKASNLVISRRVCRAENRNNN